MKEKYKKFFKKNIPYIILWSVIIVSFSILAAITIRHNIWYNSLTPEEKAVYELQKQQEYESNIYTYEVLSVQSYIRTRTNNFGGVRGTDLCYAFTYTDGTRLYTEDDFQNLPNGYTKVTLGDKNLYIINRNSSSSYTLQLTKETFDLFGK